VQLLQLASHSTPAWADITKTRPNVLLEGPPHATEAAAVFLLSHAFEPIVKMRSGEGLELGAGPCSTLVLHDVDTLSADEQISLLRWIDDAPSRVQVVSTCSAPLYSRVTRGLFDERLYYRLNVILCR
jgi:transcriptional regulator of aromatic amino acid metabolism